MASLKSYMDKIKQRSEELQMRSRIQQSVDNEPAESVVKSPKMSKPTLLAPDAFSDLNSFRKELRKDMNQKYFGFGKIYGLNSMEAKTNLPSGKDNTKSPSISNGNPKGFVSHKRPASINLNNKSTKELFLTTNVIIPASVTSRPTTGSGGRTQDYSLDRISQLSPSYRSNFPDYKKNHAYDQRKANKRTDEIRIIDDKPQYTNRPSFLSDFSESSLLGKLLPGDFPKTSSAASSNPKASEILIQFNPGESKYKNTFSPLKNSNRKPNLAETKIIDNNVSVRSIMDAFPLSKIIEFDEKLVALSRNRNEVLPTSYSKELLKLALTINKTVKANPFMKS